MLSNERLQKINAQLFYEVCTSKEVRDFLFIFSALEPNDDIDFALEMLDMVTDPVLRKAINVVLDEVTYGTTAYFTREYQLNEKGKRWI